MSTSISQTTCKCLRAILRKEQNKEWIPNFRAYGVIFILLNLITMQSSTDNIYTEILLNVSLRLVYITCSYFLNNQLVLSNVCSSIFLHIKVLKMFFGCTFFCIWYVLRFLRTMIIARNKNLTAAISNAINYSLRIYYSRPYYWKNSKFILITLHSTTLISSVLYLDVSISLHMTKKIYERYIVRISSKVNSICQPPRNFHK